MMLVEETAVPDAALPIEAFKAHLRLGTGFSDDAVQDVVLASFLRAALAAIEARSGRSILERSFSWTLTAWRDRSRQILPIAEVSSVQSVKFKDQAGDETTLSDTDYRLTLDSNRPCSALLMVPAVSMRLGQRLVRFGQKSHLGQALNATLQRPQCLVRSTRLFFGLPRSIVIAAPSLNSGSERAIEGLQFAPS